MFKFTGWTLQRQAGLGANSKHPDLSQTDSPLLLQYLWVCNMDPAFTSVIICSHLVCMFQFEALTGKLCQCQAKLVNCQASFFNARQNFPQASFSMPWKKIKTTPHLPQEEGGRLPSPQEGSAGHKFPERGNFPRIFSFDGKSWFVEP